MSRQAIQPTSGGLKGQVLKHAKSYSVDKNPQSMVGSQLKLEVLPSKQLAGHDSDDDDPPMSDNSQDKLVHEENAVTYGKSGSRLSRVSKMR